MSPYIGDRALLLCTHQALEQIVLHRCDHHRQRSSARHNLYRPFRRQSVLIAIPTQDLTANIANLGADGDSSSVLDSKGKPIMLMLKFGENAQILDCTTGLLLLSTIHRGDDNVVLTTPENEELANIVQHRSVLGKTRAECSITGLVFVADSNSSIVISHPSRGEVARVRWDKNNYEGHHFELVCGYIPTLKA